ncbi:CHAT domain-containing protein [Aspergillus navahoensis]
MLSYRYNQTERIDDLEEAIRTAQKAVNSTPEDHPDLANRLNTLANGLFCRYNRIGQTNDLEEAIWAAQRAVNSTPEDHPDLASLLNTLANSLSDRYNRTGRIDDLEKAIRTAQKAVDLTPEDHPRLAIWLNTLANMLSDRYKRTGQINDLEEAIRTAQRAVTSTPEDHPHRAGRLNNLAVNLSDRYNRTGQINDLEEAIWTAQKARNSTPEDHPSLTVWLNNLANLLSDQYNRKGRIDDLEEAIRTAQKAVNLIPEDHPALTRQLDTLANMLSDRYNRTGQIADLEAAIQISQRGINITPEDHPDLTTLLNNLAVKLSDRYDRTGQINDLEEAIRTAQKAVDLTPEDHPALAMRLNNLAKALSDRYYQTHDQEDRRASRDNYLKAYQCQNAIPQMRIQAARRTIKLLVEDGDFQQAHFIAKEALRLLPLLCGRSLSREDQQHAVTQTAGLAAEACSLLLRTKGDPADGVEYLEQGRGIVIGYLIDGRGDISDLEDKHPEVAKEFDRLRYKASAPIQRDGPPNIQRQLFQERVDAVRAFEQYLDYIRNTLSGFERFLLSPALQDLMRYASHGPIVIVNVTSISSDGLLIRESGVQAVPLPNFRASEVEQHRPWGLTRSFSRLMEKEGEASQDRGTEFRQFLGYLWSACVHPVLEKLEFLQPASDATLPRIWWIGTGLASGLPFHAAGIHLQGAAEHAFMYAISSYTPSIKTLRYVRDRTVATPSTQSILLVTMPETPGAYPLPGVQAEAAAIRESVSAPHAVHPLRQPSAEAVLRALPDCSIAHFACHGSSDLTDPSSSYLALQGQSESVHDPLTVQMISESRLGRAWLAYLSACSTAENQVAALADEALHLASGFQVAGFGHTVASMWPSNDDICAQVASTFYRELLTNGRIQEGNRGVAAALHTAVAEIRPQYPDQPYLWAQYIHVGA